MTTTKPLRTLIVDGSVLFRSFLRRCLLNIEGIELVGTAADGELAMKQIKALKPDVVTLDVELAKLDGIAVLQRMQQVAPRTRVLLVAGESHALAERTLVALDHGAFDFIVKPHNANLAAVSKMRGQLQSCIRNSRSIERVVASVRSVNRESRRPVATGRPMFEADIIAIGSSTGGPAALSAVIGALPADISVPVVVVQHMPELFVHSLAARLDRQSAISCHVGEDGMALLPGHVYLAPGNIHSEVIRQGGRLSLRLVDGPKVNHCKPSVDQMFFSLTRLGPEIRTLALVLTGMGADGAAGAKAIADVGGHVIVQDEASSTVWGMPGATVKAGVVDHILPLDEIAAELILHSTERVSRAAD